MDIPNVSVPEGKSGAWEVRRRTITQDDARMHALRCAINPQRMEIPVEPGVITELKHGGGIVMSDTPQEKHDHAPFVWKAKGDVLIAGLGLGMVTCAVAAKPDVTSITVVEISEDVIKLVAGSLPKRVKVILADIRTWKPVKVAISNWDYMWVDIWNEACEDNLPEMTHIRRRFCRKVRNRVECWSESRLREIVRREKRCPDIWRHI